LRPGLWHWRAPHPEWSESEPWDQRVSSYAIDDGQRLVLFDPLAVPDEILARVGEREPLIVLSAPWHERDAESLVERLGAPVYTAAPDSAQDLMDKYGITREQAGDGSPDVVWLLKEGKGEAHVFSAGDRLPMGYEVFSGIKPNDVVFWIEQYRAVLAGDTLADFGRGPEINTRWLLEGQTREQVAEGLRPLLERPVELVLASHGGPFDRAALERALA
jgi:glyoxylase-like metal-dependent hydrolase (beta-lactamase superfamily II)